MRYADIKAAVVVLLLIIGWIVFGTNFAGMFAENAAPSPGGSLLLLALVPCTYFLPFIIAMIRRKTGRVQIFLVNLIFGFTVIGWVIALIMAFGSDSADTSSKPNETNVTVVQTLGQNIEGKDRGK